MLIKNIELKDYRNYTNYKTDFDPKLNIIVGKNGAGKTNILESIIVASNTKSFRTLSDQNLINSNKDYLTIFLQTDTNNYKIVINKKNKSLYINDKLIKKTSEYIGKLNAILFKPSDLQIFTDPPSSRRKEFDLEIGKVDKKYLQALSKYNLLLKDKNKILKELEIDNNLLSIINQSMIPNIETIIKTRQEFVDEINKYINDYYLKISNTKNNIKMKYKKCCEVENIKKEINKAKKKDEYYHYASFGPHHDDYYFLIDDNEINSIASQGQKRMILISLKLSLIKYIQNKTNLIPILLLDDVLSELDLQNQERLLNIIPQDVQTIITNTDLNKINIKNKYKLIHIKEEENV